MNLLLLNYEYPPLGGGAANATQALARELAALGHGVWVVTSRFRGQPPEEAGDGFTIRRLPVWRRRMDRCTPAEMLTYIASGCWSSGSVAEAFHPDATLAFFGIPGGPVAWWLRRRRGIPYVVALRGGDVPGFMGKQMAAYHALTRPIIRRLWLGSEAVVANSAGLADLARETLPGYPFRVIPNGVDADRFRPRDDSASPADTPASSDPVRLLFVGRISTQKSLDVLLHALAALERESSGTDWRLDLVGDGPEKPRLSALAESLGIADRIRWRGWALKPEMPGVYREADLFVFPSSDEGMPNSVLEALASGLPVVASRIRGTVDLVRDGREGFLHEPGDVQTLSRAIAQLIQEPALRKQMAAAARLRAESFGWNQVARQYEDVFRTVIARRTLSHE